jgi:hypothetical protein
MERQRNPGMEEDAEQHPRSHFSRNATKIGSLPNSYPFVTLHEHHGEVLATGMECHGPNNPACLVSVVHHAGGTAVGGHHYTGAGTDSPTAPTTRDGRRDCRPARRYFRRRYLRGFRCRHSGPARGYLGTTRHFRSGRRVSKSTGRDFRPARNYGAARDFRGWHCRPTGWYLGATGNLREWLSATTREHFRRADAR